MKTIFRNTLLLLTVILFSVGTVSCSSDGYSLDRASMSIATVKAISSNSFYIQLDNGKKLYPAAPVHINYKVIDGQRVIVNFTLLSDEYQGYDHMIKINDLSNILTKKVDVLDDKEKDDFGDDPLLISNDEYWPSGIWISGGYLNLAFVQPLPVKERHRISLVKNETITYPDDGFVHLELRYNTFGDTTEYFSKSLVSFNLNSLDLEESKGLRIRRIDPKGKEDIIEFKAKDEQNNEKPTEKLNIDLDFNGFIIE